MIKPDSWIVKLGRKGMITPFEPRQIKTAEDGRGLLSFGTSAYGYDLRLSDREFKIFRHLPGQVVNPKRFNPKFLYEAELQEDQDGEYFILPSNTYALGVAVERLDVPPNILILCIGKSTYARSGLIANLTPAEPGWRGHLTLEFSNASSSDVRVYANEGVVQLLFLEGDPCEAPYDARHGKYQDQPERVVLPRT
jgi:dCTP deaminase